ncbi:MAG: hypothetical protein WCA38_20365 [Candidatus Acidiferrales bacterium]
MKPWACPDVLRTPAQPSEGDYYEAGLRKGLFGQFRLDANILRRFAGNHADDDIICGGKIELPHWRNLSDFVSYSCGVGNAFFSS